MSEKKHGLNLCYKFHKKYQKLHLGYVLVEFYTHFHRNLNNTISLQSDELVEIFHLPKCKLTMGIVHVKIRFDATKENFAMNFKSTIV